MINDNINGLLVPQGQIGVEPFSIEHGKDMIFRGKICIVTGFSHICPFNSWGRGLLQFCPLILSYFLLEGLVVIISEMILIHLPH